VLEGAYTERYRDKAIECEASHLIFRPAAEPHSDQVGDLSARCLIIEFGPEWLARVGGPAAGMDGPSSFRRGSLVWLAMRLRDESLRADDFSALTVEGLMLEMVAEAGRESVAAPGEKCPRWLSRAREYLHDNFAERVTLSAVADFAGVHPVYLAAAFRRHFRCSVGEYVRRLRIEFASREISRTDAGLADVALAAGISHQAHFSRAFKRLTGLSPGRYRSISRPS
jgi:AraC family transcriptional regulator